MERKRGLRIIGYIMIPVFISTLLYPAESHSQGKNLNDRIDEFNLQQTYAYGPKHVIKDVYNHQFYKSAVSSVNLKNDTALQNKGLNETQPVKKKILKLKGPRSSGQPEMEVYFKLTDIIMDTDMNGDGIIDTEDTRIWFEADIDENGTVEYRDLQLLEGLSHMTPEENMGKRGDVNGDGTICPSDWMGLYRILSNVGGPAWNLPAPTPTPGAPGIGGPAPAPGPSPNNGLNPTETSITWSNVYTPDVRESTNKFDDKTSTNDMFVVDISEENTLPSDLFASWNVMPDTGMTDSSQNEDKGNDMFQNAGDTRTLNNDTKEKSLPLLQLLQMPLKDMLRYIGVKKEKKGVERVLIDAAEVIDNIRGHLDEKTAEQFDEVIKLVMLAHTMKDMIKGVDFAVIDKALTDVIYNCKKIYDEYMSLSDAAYKELAGIFGIDLEDDVLPDEYTYLANVPIAERLRLVVDYSIEKIEAKSLESLSKNEQRALTSYHSKIVKLNEKYQEKLKSIVDKFMFTVKKALMNAAPASKKENKKKFQAMFNLGKLGNE